MDVNMPDPLSLQAKVAGLERRVRYLETLTFGEPRPERTPITLFSLYSEALMGCPEINRTSADPWNHVVLNLDEESLLDLAQYTDDPFPWKPLLLTLDRLSLTGHDVRSATAHLLDLSQSLLKLQGLGRIRPEDLLGWSRNDLSAL